ncbi:MAG: histidine phosphatase family protein [Propionibacteriaceae bacterium]|jgi:phosphohistidine phosphatase|nr:histidine phosphatase family protein [Propionibacteriaceae bacterium]
MSPKARTLYLMRHAEPVWGGPGVGDLQRPLTERGKRQAAAQGELLRERGIERVLCSPAFRTRETAQLAGLGTGITEIPVLYNSSASRIRTQLAAIPEYVYGVLVVAHHPGIAELARYLANGASDASALALIRHCFPPGTLVGLEFNDLWPDLHSGRLFLARIPG